MGHHHWLRGLRAAGCALLLCISLSGCLSTKFYIDPALPVVDKAQLTAPAQPRTVNVLYEFRTKGNANARGTQETRTVAIDAVRDSGLFSNVIDGATTPADSQLKVVIDNVPITDNVAAKGFGTGLTMGLIGTMVTDGYICTVSHTAAGTTSDTIVRHALHATVGNHSGPEGLSPVAMPGAIHTVIEQMVLNALKQLNDDGAFAEQ